MKVKLIKAAEFGGKKHKSGSEVNVSDIVGQKLIARGYAEIYVEPAKKEPDAPAADE